MFRTIKLLDLCFSYNYVFGFIFHTITLLNLMFHRITLLDLCFVELFQYSRYEMPFYTCFLVNMCLCVKYLMHVFWRV